MDYVSYLNDKLSKILFVTVKRDVIFNTFKENAVEDLYLPIVSSEIIDKAEEVVRHNSIPAAVFVEGMFYVLGLDEKFRYKDAYIRLLKSSENYAKFIKGKIFDYINNNNLEYAYFLLKGLTLTEENEDYYEKLLSIVEQLRKTNKMFKAEELDIIEKAGNLKGFSTPYLYEAMLYNDEEDYTKAMLAFDKFVLNGGRETEEILQFKNSVNISLNYSKGKEILHADPEKALQYFLPLLDYFEDNASLLYNIAICYRLIKNHEKAICYLNDALRIDPDYIDVINELGINYACIEDFETAIKYLRIAFEATKSVEICTNLVMCYMNAGDTRQAKLHLEIANKLDPEDEIVKELNGIIK
jgi:tetratricopeptide (TPR) repeat protein